MGYNPIMVFSIRCTCGHELLFHAGQAGTDVCCDCGTALRVPSLGELRQLEDGPAAVSTDGQTTGRSSRARRYTS